MSYHAQGTEFFTDTEQTCFYCGKTIPKGASRIWWLGGRVQDIFLHPLYCANHFVVRLARDVHEAETKEGEPFRETRG